MDRFTHVLWPRLEAVEGGWSNRSGDAGGRTLYGVTEGTLADLWRRAPEWMTVQKMPRDVAKLERWQASEIARRFYFEETGIAKLPPGWDCAALDWKYNGGPARTWLYTACNMPIGTGVSDELVKAVRGAGEAGLERYLAAREAYLRSLTGPQGWPANGKGWLKRLARVRAWCLKDLAETDNTLRV